MEQKSELENVFGRRKMRAGDKNKLNFVREREKYKKMSSLNLMPSSPFPVIQLWTFNFSHELNHSNNIKGVVSFISPNFLHWGFVKHSFKFY